MTVARVYRLEGLAGSLQTARVYRLEGLVATALAASAGVDATFDSLADVVLNGSGSSGVITSWLWEQTAGPTAVLTGVTSQVAHAIMPATVDGTTVTFRLTVGDGVGTAQDSVTHTVLPHHLWALRASVWVPIHEAVRA
jgi:hypothetical protein